MGERNYLIEGISCTGKTTVCNELQRLGHHAIHGDRVLAYQGDPATGRPVDGISHAHHIWHVDKVRALLRDHTHAITFFCGGFRNHDQLVDLFDGVFILEIDLDTLKHRLARRSDDEFGGRPSDRELIMRLHASKDDMPGGAIVVNAAAPINRVVNTILFSLPAVGRH